MAVKCQLQHAQSEGQIATGAVIGTFTIRNEHGLHAPPSAVLSSMKEKFTSRLRYKILLEKPHWLVQKV